MHQRYKRAVTVLDGRRVYKVDTLRRAYRAYLERGGGSLVVPYRASLSNRVVAGARAGAYVVAGARTVARNWHEQRFRCRLSVGHGFGVHSSSKWQERVVEVCFGQAREESSLAKARFDLANLWQLRGFWRLGRPIVW